MAVYYNEFDPYAAQWLRNLIAAGHIAPGDVDERPIQEVKADDVKGYTQCHFFAGIGGWSIALRLAGWDDTRPVWTGSCPCQPFSAAGRKTRQSDERHLWPHWARLIRESMPPAVFGEQVASAVAAGWLDEAFSDLEAKEYACAAAILPACSVGAPHKRDRVWFIANSREKRCDNGGDNWKERPILHHSHGNAAQSEQERQGRECGAGAIGSDVGNPSSIGQPRQGQPSLWGSQEAYGKREADRIIAECFSDFWRIEPGMGRVADGVPARVGKLSALGNAIVPQVAAEFIKATM